MLSRTLLLTAGRSRSCSQFQICVKKSLLCGRLSSLSLGTTQPLCEAQAIRCIHVSTGLCNDNESPGKAKSKMKARKKAKLSKEAANKEPLDEEIRDAAVQAAQSLPGDWTRTADDLMNRLSMHGVQESDGTDTLKEAVHTDEQRGTEPLLAKMPVGRGFEKRRVPIQRQSLSGSMSDRAKDDAGSPPRRRTPTFRSQEIINKVYSQPALGIFNKKDFKEDKVELEKDLWHTKKEEDISRIRGSLPRNAFEEMIQWTKEGKMWTYPIDNETEMHEERKYKFHEHIFLEHHLGQFPDKGPLRRFMDLVILGLSKNPWVSVPEKIEHIQWFADYFREKQKLLEPSMGDQAKMKELESEKDV